MCTDTFHVYNVTKFSNYTTYDCLEKENSAQIKDYVRIYLMC